MSSLEKYLPPLKEENNSSTLGKGQMSTWETELMVTLKPQQILIVPLLFITGTIGAAQSQNWTGKIMPVHSSLPSSVSTFSLCEYGTDLALKNLGLTFWSIWSFTFIPFSVPISLLNTLECFSSNTRNWLLRTRLSIWPKSTLKMKVGFKYPSSFPRRDSEAASGRPSIKKGRRGMHFDPRDPGREDSNHQQTCLSGSAILQPQFTLHRLP